MGWLVLALVAAVLIGAIALVVWYWWTVITAEVTDTKIEHTVAKRIAEPPEH